MSRVRLRIAQLSVLATLSFCASSSLANSYYNIENMSPWSTCSSCAAAGGTGPGVYHWVNYWAGSPSLDGSSAQFYISGGFPYADAIWWKQLGGNGGATHFTYDLYFYIKNPSASEALEFDINQSTGGRKYIFGTQCGVHYDYQWDVWDPANHTWRKTGVPCSVKAYAWNHLTWQVYRSNGWVHYVSVTLNGVKSYINRSYYSAGSSAYEINVAFQMDQTSAHVPYSVWLDKVTLNYW